MVIVSPTNVLKFNNRKKHSNDAKLSYYLLISICYEFKREGNVYFFLMINLKIDYRADKNDALLY